MRSPSGATAIQPRIGREVKSMIRGVVASRSQTATAPSVLRGLAEA